MANLGAALDSLPPPPWWISFTRGERDPRARSGAVGHGVAWGVVLLPGWRGSQPFAIGAGDRAEPSPVRPSAWEFAASASSRTTRASAPPWLVGGRGWPPILYVVFATAIAFAWYVPIGALVGFAGGDGGVWCRTDEIGFRGLCGAGPPEPTDDETDRLSRAGPRSRSWLKTDLTKSREIELKRVLGPWAAASIVVGTMIGSGIFLVPRTMIRGVGTANLVAAVWIVGGLLSLAGALSYAELAAGVPYLREACGPLWGFLLVGRKCGWPESSSSPPHHGFSFISQFCFPALEKTFYALPLPLGPRGGPLVRAVLAMALIVL